MNTMPTSIRISRQGSSGKLSTNSKNAYSALVIPTRSRFGGKPSREFSPNAVNEPTSSKPIGPRIESEILTVENVHKDELDPDDIIIAIMGPTGAGKSTFISTALGHDIGIGHSLQSSTNKVMAMRATFMDHVKVVLVDTPGFDDTELSDLEILKLVSEWLKSTYVVIIIYAFVDDDVLGSYEEGIELSGLLYLHRITDNRMTGAPLRDLELFQKLCGNDTFTKVILTTTMWSELDSEVGGARENELKRGYWADMVGRGSTTSRFEDTRDSAWRILDSLIALESKRRSIQIQRELVILKRDLRSTEAGQKLYDLIQEVVEKQQDIVRRMREELTNTSDPEVIDALRRELSDLRKERQKALRDIRELKPSLLGQLRHLLDRILRPSTQSGPHLRTLVSGLSSTAFDKVSKCIENLKREDAQTLADFLDTILECNLATDEGNYTLTLLVKIATLKRIYPRGYKLHGIETEAKPEAEGGTAKVYRVEYQKRSVCVKLMAENLSSEVRNAFIKEVAVWAHLSHPNILPFYGMFLDKKTLMVGLVSPWMKNSDLHTYTKTAGVREQKARVLLIFDVVEGMSYLHHIGIVHGDLKGKNVLVSDEGRALIADFGGSHIEMVNATRSPNTFSLVTGTYGWTAPELVKAMIRRPTKESDIWSFGSLCYEILSLRIPFHQHNYQDDVKRAVRDGEIPLRPDPGTRDYDAIDDRMWKLMVKCWKMEPEDRPSWEVIRDDLDGMGLRNRRPANAAITGATKHDAFTRKANVKVNHKRVKKILERIYEDLQRVEVDSDQRW